MKKNLFFVAYNYEMSKNVAANVAEFFAMRLFDSIEMFEFNNVPRKLSDVLKECGREYVEKKMRSIVKMEFDFDDAVFVAPFEYFGGWSNLCKEINYQNLVIFLHEKSNKRVGDMNIDHKLKFLTDCCDIAIDVTDLQNDEISDKVIEEIKNFYSLEV